MALRTSADGELQGIDYDQFNEYTHDYVELQRDLYAAALSPSVTNDLVAITAVGNGDATQSKL